jgi:DNA polymerase-3 subunit beta
MKLTIQTKPAKDALARLKSVAGRKTTLPILGNILLEAEQDILRLTGTDLDQQLTIWLPAKVERTGRATLPCAALHAALARMTAGELSIEINDKHTASLRSGSHRGALMGLSAEEFPEKMRVADGVEVLVTGELLGEWLSKTLPAASTDPSRPSINGVNIAGNQGKLSVVATNGHQMVIIDTDLLTELGSVIVPTDSGRTLADLLGEAEVALSFSDACMEATASNWRLVSRLIEGNYPAFRQAIPPATERKMRMKAPRATLVEALEFADVFCKETKCVYIHGSKSQPLRVTGDNPQGQGETEVADSTSTNDLSFGANVRYLIGMLGCFADETAEIQLVDERSPVVMEANGVTAVTMPMRLA